MRLPAICWSWLASDADNSTYLPDRGAAIAGSPTPTKGGVVWLPGTCGSWLASDADNSAYLPDRGAPSRASLAPTKAGVVRLPGICGSWLASDADNSTYLPDRGAAIAGKPDSHKGWSGVAPRYLWELARQRYRQLDIPAGPRHCHRGQARLSQRVICGSWLASDADNSTCLPDRGAAIAGKPDSHKR